MEKAKKNNSRPLVIIILAVLAINFIGAYFFKRLDLTQDKRYTLSQTSLNLVQSVQEPLYIEIFLDGEFPGEFKKLQDETRQFLEEYTAYNPQIRFSFFNPMDESEGADEEKRNLIYTIFKLDSRVDPSEEGEIKNSIAGITDLDKAVFDSFIGAGMKPASVNMVDKGKQSETLIFPWAIATYKGRSVKIPLLKNSLGASTSEKVESSVQQLEYVFADALNKLINEKQKKIAVLQGNGEIAGGYMADFLRKLQENYFTAPFTLDSVAANPIATLKQLKEYDLAIIAKPTQKFTEEEKEVLDQYIINGGKTLWLIDAVQVEMDSLYNQTGSTYALPRDLNLNDMFFKYGFRVEPDIIKDELATPIKLATGAQGSQTQYQEYMWKYAPFIYPNSEHPIVKNMGGIKFEFANPIDTLKNDIAKTVLLTSSQYSRKVGTPTVVNLSMVAEQVNPADYQGEGYMAVSVLLEGKFHSMYENRVLPFKDKSYQTIGKDSKMIVVSDGDVIKNQFDKNNQALELGYDKWTGHLYENKEFLLNSVNYLLDDNGLIYIRSKDVHLPMLDTQKVYDNYTQSKVITVGLPLLILLVFGLLFTFLRKRAYSK
ncbi:gliding motility-associated ABC transporter substrate-binding protein GldG [Flavobacterium rhizosphaerae]|uniref:Gliding motility-associated ABC transporter substrate-binding protein GldG n=1 Tax=Flavobacterium rhizosphaerae TaxID=3163298 RepID=A0ABW8YWE9_9FLAO